MPVLVGYMLLFVALAVFFIFIHLVIGKFVRPIKPDPEKLTIYECGEPTVGSAWIQFDLRFYVVALLFVIFDVEVAFFFPWAMVFNKATELARPDLPDARRVALVQELAPEYADQQQALVSQPGWRQSETFGQQHLGARRFGWIAFADVLVFFGVLLVGYAYLWKRGDLDWVRSTAAEEVAATAPAAEVPAEKKELVGAGQGWQP
jgi:NADH-quinone oxidoreductase subunit A